MFNIIDGFFAIRDNSSNCVLWKNFSGAWDRLFETSIVSSISFISNENPTLTKIFDTVDIVGDTLNSEDKTDTSNYNVAPIWYISTENEY
jgi:hypothetical protein